MKKGMKLDQQQLEFALLGGSVLGGGGGGSIDKGRKLASIALEYTDLYLVSIEDVDPDALILTASMVGAPGAQNQFVSASQIAKTIELFRKNSDAKLGGLIANENGGGSTVNGWIQAALSGLPLIDAPCNGRAHPTGVMGSMSLHKNLDYRTMQCCAGGNPELGFSVEAVIVGSIDSTSRLVRNASVEAGGTVAVARNPVSAAYVKEHAAVGGISHAIAVGKAYSEALKLSVEDGFRALCAQLNGEILCRGKITDFELRGEGGFDVGRVVIDGCELTFWNEYMTIEVNGKRAYTFPDLMMTFDQSTGAPLTTASLAKGMEICVFCTDMKNLKLSTTMYDADLMKTIEPIIGKEIASYHKYLTK